MDKVMAPLFGRWNCYRAR